MNQKLLCSFIFISSLPLCYSAKADQSSELERLRGYGEQQSQSIQFDKQRAKGEPEFFEEQEQWERQRQKDLSEFKKEKLKLEQKDDGADFAEDQKEKQKWQRDYEESRVDYAKKEKTFDRLAHKELVTEEEELGLDSNRPRYALRKRGLFGAPSKFGKAATSSGSGSSPSRPSGSGSPSFPPPPQFDDFNENNGGFAPAPNMSEGFGEDVPPPPPPPMFPEGGEFNNDIPPPPPPMDDFGP